MYTILEYTINYLYIYIVVVNWLYIQILYFNSLWNNLYVSSLFSSYLYIYKLHLFNLSWVLPGMPWLWMSELHLLKLKRKFKRDRISHGKPTWSGYCMFAVAIDLIVHHIWDIMRLKNAENSSGQHPFLYQRRRTSTSSDTLSRWLKHDKLTLSSTAFFHHVLIYNWVLLSAAFSNLFF